MCWQEGLHFDNVKEFVSRWGQVWWRVIALHRFIWDQQFTLAVRYHFIAWHKVWRNMTLHHTTHSPAPKDIKVQCVVLRQKVGSEHVYTLKLERPDSERGVQQVMTSSYHLQRVLLFCFRFDMFWLLWCDVLCPIACPRGCQVFLMAGRKRKMGASANYAISLSEVDLSDQETFIAKLKCVIFIVFLSSLSVLLFEFEALCFSSCFACFWLIIHAVIPPIAFEHDVMWYHALFTSYYTHHIKFHHIPWHRM